MKKVKGEVVRRERERRAWTQEELSERSQVAVRTLRRLEAGQGSLESVRRVAEALDIEPEALGSNAGREVARLMQVDPLCLELATDVVQQPLIDRLIEELGKMRREVALELGVVLPGIRLRDRIDMPAGTWRLSVRDRPVDDGPAPTAEEIMVGVRRWIFPNAWRLLGIEEVGLLLEHLHHPRLVAEVIPARVTLTGLRTLLRERVKEGQSIRDLVSLLEELAGS